MAPKKKAKRKAAPKKKAALAKKKAPKGAKPAPKGAKPAPKGAKPAPKGAKPAPKGAKPAPKAKKPVAKAASSALPVKAAQIISVQPEAQPPPPPRPSSLPTFAPRAPGDIHILVVDDEPEVLNLLVPYLRRRGFSVTEAEDGDQALERILTDHPDIVLLDVMMPGLNGWEISQYVRDRPELDHVRIIMATGIGSETNAATAPIYGADAYIDKPFRLEEVDQAVRGLIARLPAPRS